MRGKEKTQGKFSREKTSARGDTSTLSHGCLSLLLGGLGTLVFTLSFFSTNILETVAMCQALANTHWSLTLPKRD